MYGGLKVKGKTIKLLRNNLGRKSSGFRTGCRIFRVDTKSITCKREK